MKYRIVLHAVIMILLLSCTSCNREEPVDSYPYELVEVEIKNAINEIDVSFEEADLTPTGTDIVIRNESDMTILVGNDYYVQVSINEKWYDIHIEQLSFPAELFTLNPGDQLAQTLNWSWSYGVLPPGTYRILKPLWKEPHTIQANALTVPFQITNIMDYPRSGNNRIKLYTEKYFPMLQKCTITDAYMGLNIEISLILDMESINGKQDIFQQVANHAIQVWDFYPEVYMFKYDILWNDHSKKKVTIVIDKKEIDKIEETYNNEVMQKNLGNIYAFENCFTYVEESDESRLWDNIAN